MKNQASPRADTQSGSIFVWIFLMIALFAALSIAMTQGFRSGASVLTKEKSNLLATEIVDYGRALRSAVQQLRISNNCTDTNISFESSATGVGYINASAPADNTCHVFHANGGGLNWVDPPVEAGSFDYLVSGDNGIFYAGTSGNLNGTGWDASMVDLVLFLPIESKDICEQINSILDLPSDLAIDRIMSPPGIKFTGSYTLGNGLPDDGGNQAGFLGKMTACIGAEVGSYPETSGANYIYYSLLLAR